MYTIVVSFRIKQIIWITSTYKELVIKYMYILFCLYYNSAIFLECSLNDLKILFDNISNNCYALSMLFVKIELLAVEQLGLAPWLKCNPPKIFLFDIDKSH